MTAARLIAPVIDRGSPASGFDWVVENLRKADLVKESNEVELAKAAFFLTKKQFTEAVEVLKVCASAWSRASAVAMGILLVLPKQGNYPVSTGEREGPSRASLEASR